MKNKSLIIKILLPILIITIFMYRDFFIYTYKHYTYEPKMIDGKMEPPYPSYFDAFGTIQGVDANNDGMRDDIEILANGILEGLPYELKEVERLDAKNWYLLTTQSMDRKERYEWYFNYWRISECFQDLHASLKKETARLEHFWKIRSMLRGKLTNTSERRKAIDISWSQMPSTQDKEFNKTPFNLIENCKGMKVNLCKTIDRLYKINGKESSKWDSRSHQLQPKLYEDYYEKCHKK